MLTYLHLGGDTVVPEDDIIGIFDTDNTTQSRVTRNFLRRCEQLGGIVDVSGELPKSFVLCAAKGRGRTVPAEDPSEGLTVYLSQLASATLQKRSESEEMET